MRLYLSLLRIFESKLILYIYRLDNTQLNTMQRNQLHSLRSRLEMTSRRSLAVDSIARSAYHFDNRNLNASISVKMTRPGVRDVTLRGDLREKYAGKESRSRVRIDNACRSVTRNRRRVAVCHTHSGRSVKLLRIMRVRSESDGANHHGRASIAIARPRSKVQYWRCKIEILTRLLDIIGRRG